MTKKIKERANADVGLIFITYNLKRIFNLIGFEKFTDFLKAIIKSLILTFFAIKTPYLAKYRSINGFLQLSIISNYKIYFNNKPFFIKLNLLLL
ncbi:MAG: hypothetical protein DRJ01_15570 [Bacteroidetes bacterium]|nr:MAG: hypothetical protein DRJ01_15570 [Bacteroidota bacterium]